MKTIISRDNPQIKQLRKLADSARERRKAARTMLDGAHLIEMCLDAGIMPESVLVSDSAMDKPEVIHLLGRMPSVPAARVGDAIFSEVSPVETPTGILAVIRIPYMRVPDEPKFGLLLEDVQDPGNLGSILRSAAAAGVDVAWLSPGCADAWSPKVLRGGMGAHFALAIEERINLVDRAAGFRGMTVATCPGVSHSIYALDLSGPVAFMVGNEGAGLSPALQDAAKFKVTIPMPGRVESLNAAAATAICLFERVRQQQAVVRTV